MGLRIVVLFSGKGSNFDAIAHMCHEKQKHITIVGSVTNNPAAKGKEVATRWAIPCEVIDHKGFATREDFDQALKRCVERYAPDIVVLAGFMRILTPVFTQHFRCINIHPSFLPYFKGANAIKESFNDPSSPAGVSIHWVTQELDGGEIILQESLERIDEESFESFEERIHTLEHRLYPQALQRLFLEEKK